MRDCTTKRETEANLIVQAQAGEAESLDELMSRHEGLVHYVVRQQWRGSLSYSEAIHAGRIGLWRAIVGYDPERGSGLSSYASVAIRRQVWRAVQEAERARRKEKRLRAAMQYVAGEEGAVNWEVKAALYGMVERLPDKQRWVVTCYYGLDGWGGSTLGRLSQRLGCTDRRYTLICGGCGGLGGLGTAAQVGSEIDAIGFTSIVAVVKERWRHHSSLES